MSSTLEGFPLSPQQRHLWLSPEGQVSRSQLVLRLEGLLDADRLRHALQQSIERHEILRTTFRRVPALRTPFQVVHADGMSAWAYVDLRQQDPIARQHEIARIASDERSAPIDLEAGPTIRGCLLALADTTHILIATVPALCADTRSLVNLAVELAAFYQESGGVSLPGDPPLQYADFAAWENELLESASSTNEFRPGLPQATVSESPNLLLPFETRAGAGVRAGLVVQPLADDLTATIKALLEDASLAESFFLAAWATSLGHLTGAAEIPLHLVCDGRAVEETHTALGAFARPTPIVVRLAPDQRFPDIWRQSDELLRDARAGRDLPPSDVPADALGFEFIRVGPALTSGPLRLHVQDVGSDAIAGKLKLTVLETDGGWMLRLVYDTQHFSQAAIERLLRTVEVVLHEVATHSDRRLASLELLTDADRQHLLSIGRGETIDIPESVEALFAAQARRTPDRVAVVSGDHQLTYSALDSRTNQVARLLRASGVAPGTAIGLFIDRSAAMIVGLLGALKAGAAYVPLSPEHPPARLRREIEEVGATVILTVPELSDRLPSSDARRILLEGSPELDGESPEPLAAAAGPADPAYVLYTSGSTGQPKGVSVTRGNLANYTAAVTKRLHLQQIDGDAPRHFATVSTLAADLGNTAIFPALVTGGCLHVIDADTAADADAFAAYTARHPIDVLKIVPSHLNALMSVGATRVLPRHCLILGGEALTWDLVDQIQRAGTCHIANHYGPTETTVGSLVYSVEPDRTPRRDSRTVPIGRPLANTEIYLLDNARRLVPFGVAGELFIGGAGVSAGYVGQASLTSERFVDHPFSTDPSARLYRTGDLARFLVDGEVEFLGRQDNQVKLRGYRVELGEIEAVLASLPVVRQAAVVTHADERGELRLAAYVALREPSTVEALQRSMREQLPDYMVPARIVVLSALPLTPNGKIDRRALPTSDERGDGSAFIGPRTRIEQEVAQVWGEMLARERVSVHDNFFELGGHSLLVTQVISRLRTRLQMDLPLRMMFEHPTVAAFAVAVTRLQAERQAQLADPMLEEIDRLSEEEAEALLDAEPRAGN